MMYYDITWIFFAVAGAFYLGRDMAREFYRVRERRNSSRVTPERPKMERVTPGSIIRVVTASKEVL